MQNNILDEIVRFPFPETQFYKEETKKTAIVLHHTVSGDGETGDINWWLKNPERVATHFIIGRDGKITQCYNTAFWGHHLGVAQKHFDAMALANMNTSLNKHSIAIELDSWGGVLQEKAASFKGDLVDYGHTIRGYRYYEAYSEKQLDSTLRLIEYLCSKWNIKMQYNEDMWDVSERALRGLGGIWTHVSFRPDKSDCHPQPELVQMLKNLSA